MRDTSGSKFQHDVRLYRKEALHIHCHLYLFLFGVMCLSDAFEWGWSFSDTFTTHFTQAHRFLDQQFRSLASAKLHSIVRMLAKSFRFCSFLNLVLSFLFHAFLFFLLQTRSIIEKGFSGNAQSLFRCCKLCADSGSYCKVQFICDPE